MQNSESVKIVERFFEVLLELKARKVIRGQYTFVRRFGINNGNFHQLRQDKSRDLLQLSWLSYMVTYYGVSAVWLLTGIGNMFSSDNTKR
jgi:hypothetical protein